MWVGKSEILLFLNKLGLSWIKLILDGAMVDWPRGDWIVTRIKFESGFVVYPLRSVILKGVEFQILFSCPGVDGLPSSWNWGLGKLCNTRTMGVKFEWFTGIETFCDKTYYSIKILTQIFCSCIIHVHWNRSSKSVLHNISFLKVLADSNGKVYQTFNIIFLQLYFSKSKFALVTFLLHALMMRNQ